MSHITYSRDQLTQIQHVTIRTPSYEVINRIRKYKINKNKRGTRAGKHVNNKISQTKTTSGAHQNTSNSIYTSGAQQCTSNSIYNSSLVTEGTSYADCLKRNTL